MYVSVFARTRVCMHTSGHSCVYTRHHFCIALVPPRFGGPSVTFRYQELRYVVDHYDGTQQLEELIEQVWFGWWVVCWLVSCGRSSNSSSSSLSSSSAGSGSSCFGGCYYPCLLGFPHFYWENHITLCVGAPFSIRGASSDQVLEIA